MRTHRFLIPVALLAAATVAVADEAAPTSAPAAGTVAAQPSQQPSGVLSIGADIPSADVKMTATDGRSLSLADVKGQRGTLVVFTCNHCPYVKAWQNRLVRIGNSASEKGIGVVAINSNDPKIVEGDGIDAMRELATGKGYRFPYVVDPGSKVARAFGAGRTPEAFLFDAEGRLVYHGAIDDNSESAEAVKERWLHDAVTALLEGREIVKKETKAIGCSIKFPKA